MPRLGLQPKYKSDNRKKPPEIDCEIYNAKKPDKNGFCLCPHLSKTHKYQMVWHDSTMKNTVWNVCPVYLKTKGLE